MFGGDELKTIIAILGCLAFQQAHCVTNALVEVTPQHLTHRAASFRVDSAPRLGLVEYTVYAWLNATNAQGYDAILHIEQEGERVATCDLEGIIGISNSVAYEFALRKDHIAGTSLTIIPVVPILPGVAPQVVWYSIHPENFTDRGISEQNIRHVSPESAPNASPDEPSM